MVLYFVCYEGFIDIVKFLLGSKVKFDLQDLEGDSLLYFSVYGYSLLLCLIINNFYGFICCILDNLFCFDYKNFLDLFLFFKEMN